MDRGLVEFVSYLASVVRLALLPPIDIDCVPEVS
jgi:hypothetical protein